MNRNSPLGLVKIAQSPQFTKRELVQKLAGFTAFRTNDLTVPPDLSRQVCNAVGALPEARQAVNLGPSSVHLESPEAVAINSELRDACPRQLLACRNGSTRQTCARFHLLPPEKRWRIACDLRDPDLGWNHGDQVTARESLPGRIGAVDWWKPRRPEHWCCSTGCKSDCFPARSRCSNAADPSWSR